MTSWCTRLFLAGLMFSAWGAGVEAVAETANPYQPVASDGRQVKVVNHAATMRGRLPNAGDDTETQTSADSASEFGRLTRLRPVAKRNPELIIGADDRFRISPTTSYPERAVVLITFSKGRCTGFMISPDTVATAGHCVSDGNNTGFFRPGSYEIFPGRNGSQSPFGSCRAKTLHSVNGWVKDGNEAFDFGAIKLDCKIGNRVGWLGMWWQDASLDGTFTRVTGYPGDKPLTLWESTDRVRASQARLVFYKNDTLGGNSGAPVWQNRSSSKPFCQGPCAMAIHAQGAHGSAFPHSSNNHGTRITETVFNLLKSWADAP